MWGLGDMGSELAHSFDDPYVGDKRQWSADWHHPQGYVDGAAKVLQDLDVEGWRKATLRAIVAEGSFASFRAHLLEERRTEFERALRPADRAGQTSNDST